MLNFWLFWFSGRCNITTKKHQRVSWTLKINMKIGLHSTNLTSALCGPWWNNNNGVGIIIFYISNNRIRRGERRFLMQLHVQMYHRWILQVPLFFLNLCTACRRTHFCNNENSYSQIILGVLPVPIYLFWFCLIS